MLIYIDNNILIDYEDGKIDLPLNDEIIYVYSYVHLQELQESKDLEIRKYKRFQTIEKLTSNRYVCHNNNNQLGFYEARPIDIFAAFDNPLAKMVSCHIHESMSHRKDDEISKCLMQKLNIEKKEINNYTPEKLFEKYGKIIKLYIENTCMYRQEVFQSLFNILDDLGFWQDKLKKGSTMNRSYDANHAYFATSCDYFVTEDKKAMVKANVAYRLYGYKTIAVNYGDFIKLIK